MKEYEQRLAASLALDGAAKKGQQQSWVGSKA
jgi:hypothetical protein